VHLGPLGGPAKQLGIVVVMEHQENDTLTDWC